MRATQFVESYFDAWNHHDPKGVADHLAANGIYRDIPENVRRTHDELVTSLDSFFEVYHHRYELIGDIMESRSSLAFQYRIHPLDRSPDGTPGTPYRGAEFISLDGDAAIDITDYYDVPGISQPPQLARLASNKTQESKYAKSGLNDDQLLEYKIRLENIMETDKVYLYPNLTLPKLAASVGCSVNHLSQVINSGFGMSFFDFMNQHRIAHAKQLLSGLGAKNGAILNVAFTVGFNSNSAFYAAFKKCVGQTPAQYRRIQSSLSS